MPLVNSISVDYVGLEEVNAWTKCGTHPSRQRIRGRGPVTIRVQPQLLAAIDDLVADADRSRSRAIRDALHARHDTVKPT